MCVSCVSINMIERESNRNTPAVRSERRRPRRKARRMAERCDCFSCFEIDAWGRASAIVYARTVCGFPNRW